MPDTKGMRAARRAWTDLVLLPKKETKKSSRALAQLQAQNLVKWSTQAHQCVFFLGVLPKIAVFLVFRSMPKGYPQKTHTPTSFASKRSEGHINMLAFLLASLKTKTFKRGTLKKDTLILFCKKRRGTSLHPPPQKHVYTTQRAGDHLRTQIWIICTHRLSSLIAPCTLDHLRTQGFCHLAHLYTHTLLAGWGGGGGEGGMVSTPAQVHPLSAVSTRAEE